MPEGYDISGFSLFKNIMKRFLLIIMAALMTATTASATDYTDKLRVMVDGNTVSASTNTASLELKDAAKGTYKLTVKNVKYSKLGQTIGIGTIVVDNFKGETMPDGAVRLSAKSVKIEKGDDPDVQYWMGAMSFLPIVGTTDGRLTDDNFYCVTTFNLLVTNIKIVFGDGGFQISNSDFEDFHTINSVVCETVEPNRWHTLASAGGFYSGAVLLSSPRSYQSDSIRPGSTGEHSAVVCSSSLIGFGANGILTTGRVKAGSAFATSSSNHQYLDLTDTDRDANGDPFYTKLNACPDSIAFWVRFKQGPLSNSNKKYKYASMHAIITDGTLYQDPEPSKANYTCVVAKATDDEIESTDEWRRVCLPFDYDSYSANQDKARAILVTFSTNAKAGVASKDSSQPDSLWVDDLSLIYNARVEGITVKGKPIENFSADRQDYSLSLDGELSADDFAVTTNGHGTLLSTTLTKTLRGCKAVLEVMSADYQTSHSFTLNISGATPTGIGSVSNNATANAVRLYSADGQRIGHTQKGLNIVRMADGTVRKVLGK